MARGTEADALNSAGTAAGQSKAAYNTLAPTLNTLATAAPGYSPTDLTNMTTAAVQSNGGSTAGAVGQGNLEAARTNNAGGYTAALDDSARNGQVQNSVDALGVMNQNAQLKQKQQQEGLSGLEDIYGGANSTNINALGQATQAANETNSAWQGALAPVMGVLGTNKRVQGIGS